MRAGRGSTRGEPACERPELAARVCDWPELPPHERACLEAHALTCRECGAGLALVRETEAWLEQQVPSPNANLCPSAEELYDYGRAPGARPLPEVERMAVRAHLATCGECSALVETLALRPPAVLIDLPCPADRTATASAPPLPRPRARVVLLGALASIAAAAAAVAIFWPRPTAPSSTFVRFPAAELLRGEPHDALLFPRHAVLLEHARPWQPLRFELAPRERATRYRIVLRATDGGAFDVGHAVLRLESDTPELAADASFVLAPAHYTWDAWADVDGLTVELGSRDFEARADAGLCAELAACARASEPTRSESILNLLHERGLEGDARAFARTLPASPERDAYLARRPLR
ncbi:MAG: hypothetical protein FJ298_15145 [Planctomycetes bacterium]|nr:hypothetical protein [Planctomycetota bacterium]